MSGVHSVQTRSAWPTILLIVGAGVVSAFQVGKAPMALSAVREELGLGLATVSWLISAFAIIGAIAGAFVGLVVDRVGARRMAPLGLLLMGAGSALGALAPSIGSLLATRVLEGLGFLGVIIAAPALIAAAAPDRVHNRAMALWATFMPVGMTVIMLAAPLMTLLSWRGFWLLNAAILIGYAALLGWGAHAPARRPMQHRPILQDVSEALAAPGPWILGGLFAAFSAAFFALFGFLPSLLTERLGIGDATASMLSAVAIAASGVGNIACGQLLARGFRPTRLLFASFATMTLCGVGVFSWLVPGMAAYGLCIVFSFAGGFIPVVIFDSAPRYAPHPALVGVTLGFAMQGNNIGLLVGPAAAGGIAAAFGWPAVSLLIAAIALAAALLIAAFRALSHRSIGHAVDFR